VQFGTKLYSIAPPARVAEQQLASGRMPTSVATFRDGWMVETCKEEAPAGRCPPDEAKWLRLPQIAFVLYEYCQLLEVPGFPVPQVGFQDHMGGLEHPAQLSLVGKADTHVEHSFFENVFGPIHNLAPAVRRTRKDADTVGDCVVVDIKNNEARLISSIDYGMGTVTVLAVLTHKDYDKGGWKSACNC